MLGSAYGLKPVDFIIFSAAIILSVYFIISSGTQPESKRLVLVVDNKKTVLPWKNGLVDLNKVYNKNMIVEIKDNRARVLYSNCPDKLCEKTGWVSVCGEVAACLPNKTAIMVVCDDKEFHITDI